MEGPNINIDRLMVNNQIKTEWRRSSPLKTYSKKTSPSSSLATGDGKSRYGRSHKPKLSGDFLSTDKKVSQYLRIDTDNQMHYFKTSPYSYKKEKSLPLPGEKRGRGRPPKKKDLSQSLLGLPVSMDSPIKSPDVRAKATVDLQAPAPTSTQTLPIPTELMGLKDEPISDTESMCEDAEWNCGDLAWANIGGFPYWPCTLTKDPYENVFRKTKISGRGRQERLFLHVRFFGDQGRRSWVVSTHVMPFQGLDSFQTLVYETCTPEVKKRDPRMYRAFCVTAAIRKSWQAAVSEAESLMESPRSERIIYFHNLYPPTPPPSVVAVASSSGEGGEVVVKKKRGRKRKVPLPTEGGLTVVPPASPLANKRIKAEPSIVSSTPNSTEPVADESFPKYESDNNNWATPQPEEKKKKWKRKTEEEDEDYTPDKKKPAKKVSKKEVNGSGLEEVPKRKRGRPSKADIAAAAAAAEAAALVASGQAVAPSGTIPTTDSDKPQVNGNEGVRMKRKKSRAEDEEGGVCSGLEAYQAKHFERICEENPGLSHDEVEKYLDKMWSEMTDQQKARYRTRVNNDSESEGKEGSEEQQSRSQSPQPITTATSKSIKRGCMLFSGVKSEKVCQVCLKGGDVLKCRGPCCTSLHANCGQSELSWSTTPQEEKPTSDKPGPGRKPGRGRKKKSATLLKEAVKSELKTEVKQEKEEVDRKEKKRGRPRSRGGEGLKVDKEQKKEGDEDEKEEKPGVEDEKGEEREEKEVIEKEEGKGDTGAEGEAEKQAEVAEEVEEKGEERLVSEGSEKKDKDVEKAEVVTEGETEVSATGSVSDMEVEGCVEKEESETKKEDKKEEEEVKKNEEKEEEDKEKNEDEEEVAREKNEDEEEEVKEKNEDEEEEVKEKNEDEEEDVKEKNEDEEEEVKEKNEDEEEEVKEKNEDEEEKGLVETEDLIIDEETTSEEMVIDETVADEPTEAEEEPSSKVDDTQRDEAPEKEKTEETEEAPEVISREEDSLAKEDSGEPSEEEEKSDSLELSLTNLLDEIKPSEDDKTKEKSEFTKPAQKRPNKGSEDTETSSKSSDTDTDSKGKAKGWMCKLCSEGKDWPCYLCGQNGEQRTRCNIGYCGKVYHMDCVKRWPQTQVTQGAKGRVVLHCPQHACHTCISDNPTAITARFTNDKLVRCVKCPTSYHYGNYCIPAGSEILSSAQIVCPKHYVPLRKGTHHVNAAWCFICAMGGSLICCDLCPTSFHAECLKISPPEGSYICEDCETGRYPLYGEIVWVKLGAYRWWPAQILYPQEVPDNIRLLPHSSGEFAVKFFGSHDYYWVNRGRVFLYHEGDGGKVNNKSRMDEVFLRGIAEASDAFTMYQTQRATREATVRPSMKPPKYVKIQSNKIIGPIRSVELDASNMTPCECDPDQATPCGPDSDCINRLLMVECNPQVCPAGERCTNQNFEKKLYPPLAPFMTDYRGWGLKTLVPLKKGDFVIEYVGEMIDEVEYRKRLGRMQKNKDENYYFLTIDKDRMLDAGPKGNMARFMNHSCAPNCETQKWTVNGDTRVGLFTLADVPAGTELVFNYNLETIGNTKVECKCGAPNCVGFIGAKQPKVVPSSDDKRKRVKKRRGGGRGGSRGGGGGGSSVGGGGGKVTEDRCFTCGEGGELLLCDESSCPKAYHLSCLGLTKHPAGGWVCPWHQCSVCSGTRVQRCTLCINSYCSEHAEGNIALHRTYGLLCYNHTTSESGSDWSEKAGSASEEEPRGLNKRRPSKGLAQPPHLINGH